MAKKKLKKFLKNAAKVGGQRRMLASKKSTVKWY